MPEKPKYLTREDILRMSDRDDTNPTLLQYKIAEEAGLGERIVKVVDREPLIAFRAFDRPKKDARSST